MSMNIPENQSYLVAESKIKYKSNKKLIFYLKIKISKDAVKS